MTPKQSSFISACVSAGLTSPVSRTDLVEVAKTLGSNYAPAWIVKDANRKAGRGLFDLPKLTGDNLPAAPAPRPAAPAKQVAPVVSAPAPIPATVNMVAGPSVAAMDGSEACIPARQKTFIEWGNYSDIETIVRSGMFCTTYVTGLSGNGKTTMIEQVCAKNSRPWVRVNITKQTNEDDLMGGFRLIDGETVWVDGPVTVAAKSGAVLCLDEVDLGGALMMCLQPVLEGKSFYLKKIRQWVTPAAGFTIFATANTKGKGSDDGRFAHTNVQNEAFLDRFAITMEQDYPSVGIEKRILNKVFKSLSIDDAAFATHLVKWADITRKAFNEGAIGEVISTRRLETIAKSYAMFGDKKKSMSYALARFDAETKEAFMDLYEKIDADVREDSDAFATCIRVNLGATFEQKDAVKRLGAKWDNQNRTWYVSGDTYRADTETWSKYAPTAVTENTEDCPF